MDIIEFSLLHLVETALLDMIHDMIIQRFHIAEFLERSLPAPFRSIIQVFVFLKLHNLEVYSFLLLFLRHNQYEVRDMVFQELNHQQLLPSLRVFQRLLAASARAIDLVKFASVQFIRSF